MPQGSFSTPVERFSESHRGHIYPTPTVTTGNRYRGRGAIGKSGADHLTLPNGPRANARCFPWSGIFDLGGSTQKTRLGHRREEILNGEYTMQHNLRPYQVKSLNDLRAAIKSGSRSIVLQAPTAYGKTTLAAEIMKGAVAKGNRAYFIADSIELIDQTFDRFTLEGLDCGVIRASDDRTDYAKPIQIATVQTLRNRWNDITVSLRPKVVVVDETHVFHKSHQDVIRDSLEAGAVVLGLSATPWRKGLGKHFETLVLGESIQNLVRDGYLAPLTIYAPRVPDLTGVPTKGSGGDYKEDALAEIMGDSELIGDIVQHWQQYAHDRQTLVFGINVAHSRSLCDAFKKVGIRAEHIDGY